MIAFLGEKDKGSSVPLESPICLIAPSRNEHICRSAKFNPFCWRSPSALDFCQKTKPDHGKLLFICLQSVTLLGRGHAPPVDIRPLADVRLSRTMAQVCPSMLQGTNSGGPHPTVLRGGPLRAGHRPPCGAATSCSPRGSPRKTCTPELPRSPLGAGAHRAL